MDDADKKALIEKTVADRGWVLPEQEFYIQKDPECHVRQSALYNHVIKREGALSEKMRERIIITALCVRLPGTEVETYVKTTSAARWIWAPPRMRYSRPCNA